MRLADTLRLAGGTRGIEHHADVVVGALAISASRKSGDSNFGIFPIAIVPRFVVDGLVVMAHAARIVINDVFERRTAGRALQAACHDPFLVLGQAKGPGVLQHEQHLGTDRILVERHRHRRRRLHGGHHHARGGAVVADDGKVVATLEAHLGQTAGEFAHVLGDVVPGPGPPDAEILSRIAGLIATHLGVVVNSRRRKGIQRPEAVSGIVPLLPDTPLPGPLVLCRPHCGCLYRSIGSGRLLWGSAGARESPLHGSAATVRDYNCRHPDISEKLSMPTLAEALRDSAWGRELTGKSLNARSPEPSSAASKPAPSCMKGEPVDHWMGVIDGLVKMASNWVTGKTTTFTGLTSGGWFGEGSMLKKETRKYDVMALRESRVAYMNRGTFLWLMDHSIPFNRFPDHAAERTPRPVHRDDGTRASARHRRPAGAQPRRDVQPGALPGTARELQISQEELGFLCRPLAPAGQPSR